MNSDDQIAYEKIIATLPQVLKYQAAGSRIPLLQQILDACSAPDKTFPTIHICGTNGKGSTSKMIAELLRNLNYDVGVFSSPAMYDDREQVTFNGEVISYTDFVECYRILTMGLDELDLSQMDISVFETWYLLSAIFFAEKKADFVVYECGLGGEFDATNATRNVKYTIFTKIALDHLDILGPTIDDIATTKSKIIRENVSVVNYPQQLDVVNSIIQAETDRKNAMLVADSRNHVELVEEHLTYSLVDLTLGQQAVADLRFDLGGLFQLENLQNVLNWVERFNHSNERQISLEDIEAVLPQLHLDGRMDLLQYSPPTIIDGAHNYNAIDSLVDSVTKLHDQHNLLVVAGFLADKQYRDCVDRLLDLPASFVITSPDNHQRALPAEELLESFQENAKAKDKHLMLASSIDNAVELAQQMQQKTDALVIYTGSFYLINKIKSFLNKSEE